jgi:hypothetical protein
LFHASSQFLMETSGIPWFIATSLQSPPSMIFPSIYLQIFLFFFLFPLLICAYNDWIITLPFPLSPSFPPIKFFLLVKTPVVFIRTYPNDLILI